MVSPMLGMEPSHIEWLKEAAFGFNGDVLLGLQHRWAPAQWILLVAALALLIISHTEWSSPLLVGLLIPLIFINAPDKVFEFFRSEPGHWIAFVVVLAILYTPPIYIPPPTNLWSAIVLLLVVAPSWVVGLRYTLWGALISLVIAAILASQHVVDANNDPEGPQSTFTRQRRLPTTVALVLTIVIPIYFFVDALGWI